MAGSDALVAAARKASEFAYAKLSNFHVGAALETRDGRVFTGCNIENATYGLTVCAERVAIFKAMSEGLRRGDFVRIAVVAAPDDPTPPCGACRQIIWEMCGDIEVVLANHQKVHRAMQMSDLLPLPFDERLL
ncbi:MAG: Cytidine deaminase [Acidobacteriota bacterium]